MHFNILAIALALFATNVAANYNGTATPAYYRPSGRLDGGSMPTPGHSSSSGGVSPPISSVVPSGHTGAAAAHGVAGSAFGLVVAGAAALVL